MKPHSVRTADKRALLAARREYGVANRAFSLEVNRPDSTPAAFLAASRRLDAAARKLVSAAAHAGTTAPPYAVTRAEQARTNPPPISARIGTDGPSRELRHWRGGMTAVRRYAREHGAAGALRANGSYVLVFRDGDRLKQKAWREWRPAARPNSPLEISGRDAKVGRRAVLMSREVVDVTYKHVQSSQSKPYRHPFGRGVNMYALADGSILFKHSDPRRRLWEDRLVGDDA